MPPKVMMPPKPEQEFGKFQECFGAINGTDPTESNETDAYKRWRQEHAGISSIREELKKLPQQAKATPEYDELMKSLSLCQKMVEFYPRTQEDLENKHTMYEFEQSLSGVIGKGGLKEKLYAFQNATGHKYYSNNAIKATSYLCRQVDRVKVGVDKIALENRQAEVDGRAKKIDMVSNALDSFKLAAKEHEKACKELGNKFTADTANARKQELAAKRQQLSENEANARKIIATHVAQREMFQKAYERIAQDRADTLKNIEENKAQVETYKDDVYSEKKADERAEAFEKQSKEIQEKIQFYAQREQMLDLGVLRDDVHECARAAAPDVDEKYFEKYVDRYFLRGKCEELLNVRTEPKHYAAADIKKLATPEGRQALIEGNDKALRTLAQKTDRFAKLHESAFDAADRGYTGYVHSLRGRVKSGDEVTRLAVEDFLKRNPEGGDFGAELNIADGPIHTLGVNLKTSLVNMGGAKAYQAIKDGLKARKEEAHNDLLKALNEQDKLASDFTTQGKFLGYEVKGIEHISEKTLPRQQKFLEELDKKEADTRQKDQENEAEIDKQNDYCRRINLAKETIDKEIDQLSDIIGTKDTLDKKQTQLNGVLNDYRNDVKEPVRPFEDVRLTAVKETLDTYYAHRADHQGSHGNSEEYDNVIKALDSALKCNNKKDMATKLTELEASVDTYLERKGSRTWGSTLRHVRMGMMKDIKEYCATVKGTLGGEAAQMSKELSETDRIVRGHSNEEVMVSTLKDAPVAQDSKVLNDNVAEMENVIEGGDPTIDGFHVDVSGDSPVENDGEFQITGF